MSLRPEAHFANADQAQVSIRQAASKHRGGTFSVVYRAKNDAKTDLEIGMRHTPLAAGLSLASSLTELLTYHRRVSRLPATHVILADNG